MTEDLKRMLIWGTAAILLVLGAIGYGVSIYYDKQKQSQTMTVERVTGDYQLVSVKDNSGLYITVKDKQTNKIYNDSFVSKTCPLINVKNQPGKELKLVRFTNINLVDNTTSYFFKGAYEQLCTNLKFDPKGGDNYFKN